MGTAAFRLPASRSCPHDVNALLFPEGLRWLRARQRQVRARDRPGTSSKKPSVKLRCRRLKGTLRHFQVVVVEGKAAIGLAWWLEQPMGSERPVP